MPNYYYLGTYLPSLRIGASPDIKFEELIRLLKGHLTKHDYEKTVIIRRYWDILNIRALLLHEEPDHKGNFTLFELEEALLKPGVFPDYVYDFMNKYPTTESRIKEFPLLIASYFREELKHSSGILREFLKIERDLRLVMAGFRAERLGRDVMKELESEDPRDPVVENIADQKGGTSYTPPEPYTDLKPIYEQYADEPLALNKALLQYRFDKIDEMIKFDVFSIDRILGYMVQLILVEHWAGLDKKKGLQVLDHIFKEVA